MTKKLTSLTATDPLSTVPVMTVPWPRMGKQWSTEKTNAPDEDRFGTNTLEDRTCNANRIEILCCAFLKCTEHEN